MLSRYFKWQKQIGIFGAQANKIKFEHLIEKNLKVLDFGCGGGYLLNEFKDIERYGIEVNDTARNEALNNENNQLKITNSKAFKELDEKENQLNILANKIISISHNND